jgi:hypothetical protein
VRDDRRDLRRRRTPRRVDHQQQLHQVVLGRRHQRLNDVDVPLAAVREQLRLQAVVAEALDLRAGERYAEVAADAPRQRFVGRA